MSDLIARLKELEAKATPGNLDTSERTGSQIGVECPACQGEGYVDAESYTNFDAAAIGVQFFGVGDEHGAHEELWRFFMANRRAIIARLEAAERMREALGYLHRDAERFVDLAMQVGRGNFREEAPRQVRNSIAVARAALSLTAEGAG